MIDQRKLEHYLDKNYNVLLIGEKGVGKTEVVKQVMNRKGLKWLYFSGATLDPWISFIGIPREKQRDNRSYIDFIKPDYFTQDIEAIVIDELNRADQKIQNCLMELIQFKTMNGEHFPNLRVVWGMINPYDDEGTYNVNKLDPAQMDRFHIHLQVPYDIDRDYFTGKYGKQGELMCEWWDNLSDPIKHKVSPRRADYALEIYNNDGDLRDVLPEESNISKLLLTLNKGSIRDQLDKLMATPNQIKDWINNENNYSAAIDFIVKENRYKEAFIQHLKPEKMSSLIAERYDILKYVGSQYFLNSKINKAVDTLVFSADKSLRDKIYKEIDNAIPSPDTINFSKFGKKAIVPQLTNKPYTKLNPISTFKTSDDRAKHLREIADNLSSKMINDDYKDLTNQLLSYCGMSHYSTVAKNYQAFMYCVNVAVKPYITTNNVKDGWIAFFKDNPKIYTRVYGANLWEYCAC